MKKINKIIPVQKEETCLILGGIGHQIAESIGVGIGRFTRGFCRFIKQMMCAKDYVSYR